MCKRASMKVVTCKVILFPIFILSFGFVGWRMLDWGGGGGGGWDYNVEVVILFLLGVGVGRECWVCKYCLSFNWIYALLSYVCKLMYILHCTSVISFKTSSRREYYIFSGLPCGIIFSENSEKYSSNFSDNETMSGQPNKRLIHWHFKN